MVYYWMWQFLNNVIIIKTKVLPIRHKSHWGFLLQ
jgi:hypothetical protein